MREHSMKKTTGRSFGAPHIILIIFTVTVLMYGCSDMITTLLASTAAGEDAAALGSDDFTFASGNTADAITGDFTLPITGELNTTTISWESDNTDIITIDNETGTATVTTPEDADTDVTLTATLTDADGTTVTKTIIVTVVVSTDAGVDADALSAEDITFASDDTAGAVAGDFTLPITGELNTSTITWESDSTDIIAINEETGTTTVTRPADADTEVTLTATITDADGNTSTKTVTLSVLASTDAGDDTAALSADDIIFASGNAADTVAGNFTLPITGEVNGSTISWESDNADVITLDNETGMATVTRPADENAEVTLTATVTDADGNTSTKTVPVTVVASTAAGDDMVALSADDITFASGDTADAVTGDFTLPITGEINTSTTISWESDNTDIITIDDETGTATVTRPATDNSEVTLTATITDAGGNTTTKTIKVTVAAPTVAGEDAAALGTDDITFASGDTVDAVTGNFTLPTSGEVNTSTTISWESSNTDVITISGGTATVTRPADTDAEVTLTATLTDEDDNTSTKTVTVTVKAVVQEAGFLDTSFNASGDKPGLVLHKTTEHYTVENFGLSMALDSDGKILVTGSEYTSTASTSSYVMVLWRYNSDGTLDSSFGDSNGFVFDHDAAGRTGFDMGRSVAVDSSGRILVTGQSYNSDPNSGNHDMVIWRYDSDGTLDETFNASGTKPGIVAHDGAAGGSSTSDVGSSVTVDSNGKILVTGYSYNTLGDPAMALWRYNDDGTLDDTFNTSGIVTYSRVQYGADQGHSVTVASDGKMLVAGESSNGTDMDMTLWRYNSDGTLDTNFGSDGIVTHHNAAGGDGWDYGYSMTLDTNGKILVTGRSQAETFYNMALWRYNDDGTLDTTFSDDGIVVFSDEDIYNTNGYSIQTDSNGKILVTGEYEDNTNYSGMAIWRYESDGSPDTTFGSNGIVKYHIRSDNSTGKSLAIDSNGKILVSGSSYNHMAIWRYE